MPTFCRHNRLLQNCTICAREQQFEARPVVSSSAPKSTQARERSEREDRARGDGARVPRTARPGAARGGSGSLRVRRLARGVEDGYHSQLIPGLKSSEDARRLAEEIAFSAFRLALMEQVAAGVPSPDTPASWGEILAAPDLPARTRAAIDHVLGGGRGVGSEDDREAALAGIEAWGVRAGSIVQAFTGEPSWSPERRFERVFERLGGVRGLGRDTRYELLTLLGRLGIYALRAGRLFLSGENEATWAAKRALGIGDPLMLERRAAELARACGVPVEALDLALHNWGSGLRVADDLPDDAEGDPMTLEQAASALGL